MLNKHSASFIRVNAEFPTIGQKIATVWGTAECVAYLHDLQHDTSDKPRAGFPLEVLLAIGDLESSHNCDYPSLARKDVGF